MAERDKTLVLGLGNPILGDDGVGWRAVEAFESTFDQHLLGQLIEIDYLSVGGLSLMERLIGYDHAILVDASLTGRHPTGYVSCYALEQLPTSFQGHLSSSHDTTLQNALAVGCKMGLHLPGDIRIVTIEAENIYEFSDQLSPAVSSAVPQAVDAIRNLISERNFSLNLKTYPEAGRSERSPGPLISMPKRDLYKE